MRRALALRGQVSNKPKQLPTFTSVSYAASQARRGGGRQR
jgi:hypothetical protein